MKPVGLDFSILLPIIYIISWFRFLQTF